MIVTEAWEGPIKAVNMPYIINGIDLNRSVIEAVMQQIHDDTNRALLQMPFEETESQEPRERALSLLLVQTYVTAFLTFECDPPGEFIKAVNYYYAKGREDGLTYLAHRKENSQ